ncbi:MAG: hypothetical protein H7A33_00070 [Deltaproteobacteria bacterium]|nr:hypothetical protein [Deltaproteobacteria bacterium]
MTLKNINASLQQGQDQSAQTIHDAFAEIFESDLEDDLVRDFLIGLYQKGETKDEGVGRCSLPAIAVQKAECMTKDLIDCCGLVAIKRAPLISLTATAFVLAGGVSCGVHGNRAVSSQSGSADVLSELGINITSDTHVMTKPSIKSATAFICSGHLPAAQKWARSAKASHQAFSIF